MKLVNEIRECFASLSVGGARLLSSISNEYAAYVIRILDGYGVAIEIDEKTVISERFNSCRYLTAILTLDGESKNYLMLISAFEEFRYEFASICAELVYPGENGVYRQSLLNNPYIWWEKWKELIGNVNRDMRVYDVIAEMLVLEHRIKEDPDTEWAATRMGSHDIECTNESCEVKSTLKRYGASITVSGQHQLESKKRLFLYFCRMEESKEGESINDLQTKLENLGYDKGKLELELEKLGFERGANIRNRKYKLLEKRKYEVDSSFPKITSESFKGDKFPESITHIEYTVDLDGLQYSGW